MNKVTIETITLKRTERDWVRTGDGESFNSSCGTFKLLCVSVMLVSMKKHFCDYVYHLLRLSCFVGYWYFGFRKFVFWQNTFVLFVYV